MTFVHCADLHLDSPFEGMLDEPEIAELLREATFRAWERVVETAQIENADFVLIAGDVYDSSDQSLRAQLKFLEGLERLHEGGIQVFVVHGNHDPLSTWKTRLQFPPNTHRFTDQAVSRADVVREGEVLAHIFGYSFPTRDVTANVARSFRRESGEVFSIGLLHTNVGGNATHANYAPCSISDLVEVDLDYWALGHIHQPQLLRNTHPYIAYSGNTQGRHIREPGPRGCFVVGTDGLNISRHDFVETSTVRWLEETVSIAPFENLDGLLQAIEARSTEIRANADTRPTLVRWVLTGRGALHGVLKQGSTIADLRDNLIDFERSRVDFVWPESIQTESRPLVDLDALREQERFVGEFARCAEEVRKSGGEAIRAVLAAQPEYGKLSDAIEAMPDDDLLECLHQGVWSGLDRLEEREG
ncbi:MAG: DNA repair exonuclease [Fimbriimonadaceae bacterium]|nr:putative metallophosphoesterase YhaO [Fimbriimonadaceae bacterium]MCL4284721.1 DNA repair exonuclease [Fimbriimonadaceae bacterium]QOJ12494.1 MAG: DNA repair exonuclease [Chthonomonadaceae bacterium]